MIDLAAQQKERRPSWERGLRFAELRAGVLYTGLSLDTLHRLIVDGHFMAGFAGVGPKLFFGRDVGPWVPFDPELPDQNQDCAVKDRPWPWCHGDELWLAMRWCGMWTAVRIEDDDEVSIFCLSMLVSMSHQDWTGTVRRWADSVVGPHLYQVPDPAAGCGGLRQGTVGR